MRTLCSALGALLLLAPTVAVASDYRGFLSGVIIIGAGSISALVSLFCFAILAFNRSYRNFQVAKWHTLMASVIPMLGFVAMMIEGNSMSRDDINDRLFFNGIALALAMLPLVAYGVLDYLNSDEAKAARDEKSGV